MLAFLQFTIVLDFMMFAPLGALVMPALKITPSQFGLVVSAYAFSAGLSGLLTAGFADRFDRKKLLLFFYSGFLAGTLLCGLASSYHLLLVAGWSPAVCRRRRLDVLRDRHRPVSAADARPGHGTDPDGLRRQHRDGDSAGPVAVEPLGLERTVFHDGSRRRRGRALLQTKLLPVNEHLKHHPDRSPVHHLLHTVTNGSRTGISHDRLAERGWLHAHAFHQHFHRAQRWSAARATPPGLHDHGRVLHRRRPVHRARQRRVRKVQGIRLRLRTDSGDGGDLHPHAHEPALDALVVMVLLQIGIFPGSSRLRR